MSNITIAGNSSGTATFTIEPPATSTNRTLTLPDQTGIIVAADPSTGIIPAQGLGTGTANSTTFLRGDGSWQPASSAGGSQLFVASGTFTVPSGVRSVWATIIGGGGGGGGGQYVSTIHYGGSDGGFGGQWCGRISVTPGQVEPVTVGQGGVGNNSGGNGGSGTASSFAGVIAGGGAGGVTKASPDSQQATGSVSGGFNYGPGRINLYAQGVRPNATNATSAVGYSPTGAYSPGAGGSGETVDTANNSVGGVGGLVLIEW